MNTLWRQAPCAQATDPDIFFPESRGPAARDALAEAQSYCSRCPLTVECLAEARENDYSGVWGGRLITLAREYHIHESGRVTQAED